MAEEASVQDRIVEHLPGIGILVAGALISWFIGSRISGLDELLVAIIVGVVLTNVVETPEWATAGVRTHKIWLGAGIVLMGASLALDRIVDSGLIIVLLVLCITTLTLLCVEVLSRTVFDITERLASLLAAGASVCGVSAVVAVAGSIDADEEHIAYAAATVLLFDAVTLVGYPLIGRILDLSPQVFGIWTGLSMFSTGPVVAVGFAHSDAAGQWATVTKLTRNALIGLVAVGYAAYYTRKRVATNDDGTSTSVATGIRWRELWDRFPKFVIGFLLLAVIASAGLLSSREVQSIENAYGWLFLLAFVGLGTDLKVQKLKCAGIRPVLIVFVAFVTVSVSSLLFLLVALE